MTTTDGYPERLRDSVRELVEEWTSAGRMRPACDAWMRGHDADFTRAMADRNLLGLAWPREYGGQGRSAVDRLVVTEELLRAGAPVAAHWFADRQIGPSVLTHGTQAARRELLPGIARGNVTFCLGMSETEAGSDLASVRTTATPDGVGWRITGRKIWTSHAHQATHAYVLARAARGEAKHEGLGEFVVDLAQPGVQVRPILDLRGEHHFNELVLDDAPVEPAGVIGVVGDGWRQITDQLSLERGGIERVLSTYPLLAQAVEAAGVGAEAETGQVLARLLVLRAMAVEVATAIDAGERPVVGAAVLKDLGTAFENDVNEYARRCLDVEADPGDPEASGLLAQGVLAAPGFTIRGGTTEVLRVLIARAAQRGMRAGRHELHEVVDDVLSGRDLEWDSAAWAPSSPVRDTWEVVTGLGWGSVGIPEAAGGSGGDLADLVVLAEGMGRHGVPLPVVETAVAGRALAAGQEVDPSAVLSLAVGPGQDVRVFRGPRGLVLDGRARRVPWGDVATTVLVTAVDESGTTVLVAVDPNAVGVRVLSGHNLAGEPRPDLELSGVEVDEDAIQPASTAPTAATELSLLRAAAISGALDAALAHAVEHVTTREQFGRPLVTFQAVAGLLAELTEQREQARLAVGHALSRVESRAVNVWSHVAAARVVTGAAATKGARIAHQLHGAMGITREHPLHRSTRRLWSWRDEVGTARLWAYALGHWLLGRDEEQRWRWLTQQDDEAADAGAGERQVGI